jgi:predicted nuclease of predicted toxin-antitoxin system
VTPLLLVNENFPAPAIKALRVAGFDVVAVTEDMPGATDRVVLEHARELGRWLVTFDRDYGELVFLHELPPPPAIIFIRQEPIPPDAPAEWLVNLLSDPELEPGYFITLGSKTIRRRALPQVG